MWNDALLGGGGPEHRLLGVGEIDRYDLLETNATVIVFVKFSFFIIEHYSVFAPCTLN